MRNGTYVFRRRQTNRERIYTPALTHTHARRHALQHIHVQACVGAWERRDDGREQWKREREGGEGGLWREKRGRLCVRERESERESV